jgi:hypothetical protein
MTAFDRPLTSCRQSMHTPSPLGSCAQEMREAIEVRLEHSGPTNSLRMPAEARRSATHLGPEFL